MPSIEHHQHPVTEFLPPYIFMILTSTIVEYGFSVCLWKNGHLLTVQVPLPAARDDTWSHKDDYEYIESELRELQPFTKSLVFGKTNWAYFLRNSNGRRAITYRQRCLYRIKYPPFASVVPQDEITYLRPGQGDIIEGVWKGKQVDVQLALEDASMKLLERQMKAYEMLRDLDLTFKCVAHVVDSDRNIIGIMTEPAFGRPFQASDILALNDAMCRLYDRGLYLRIDVDFLMMSSDNKIRLLTYCAVRELHEEEQEFARVELRHTLHEIYLECKDYYRWDSSYRYRHVLPVLIDPTTFLEWPIALHCQRTHEERLHAAGKSNVPLSIRQLHYRGARMTSKVPLAATTIVEEIDQSNDDDGHDAPPHINDKKHHPRSRPYHGRSRKSRRRALILAPE